MPKVMKLFEDTMLRLFVIASLHALLLPGVLSQNSAPCQATGACTTTELQVSGSASTPFMTVNSSAVGSGLPPSVTWQVFYNHTKQVLLALYFSEEVYLNGPKIQLENATIRSIGTWDMKTYILALAPFGGGMLVVVPGDSYTSYSNIQGFEVSFIELPVYIPNKLDKLVNGFTSRSMLIQTMVGLFFAVTAAFVLTIDKRLARECCTGGSWRYSFYHLQMLALTSQLAVPGLAESYRELALHLNWTVLSTAKIMNVFDLGLFVGSCVAVAGGCLIVHALILVALARTGRPITAFLKMPCVEMIMFGWVAVAMSAQAASFLESPGNQHALRVVVASLMLLFPGAFTLSVFVAAVNKALAWVRKGRAGKDNHTRVTGREITNKDGLDAEDSPHWFQFAGPLHLEQPTEGSPPLDPLGQKTLRVKRHAQQQATKEAHGQGSSARNHSPPKQLQAGGENLTPQRSKLVSLQYFWDDVWHAPGSPPVVAAASYCTLGVNIAHKCSVSFLLGYYGWSFSSAKQVYAVLAVQVAMLLYLITFRPYTRSAILWMELTLHAIELAMYVCAAVLLGNKAAAELNAALTGLFIMLVVIVLVSEMWQACKWATDYLRAGRKE